MSACDITQNQAFKVINFMKQANVLSVLRSRTSRLIDSISGESGPV